MTSHKWNEMHIFVTLSNCSTGELQFWGSYFEWVWDGLSNLIELRFCRSVTETTHVAKKLTNECSAIHYLLSFPVMQLLNNINWTASVTYPVATSSTICWFIAIDMDFLREFRYKQTIMIISTHTTSTKMKTITGMMMMISNETPATGVVVPV